MIINPKFQLKTILELDTPKVTGSQNTNENKWAELVAADLFANELTEEKFATMFVQVLQKANPQIIVKSIEGTTLKLSDGEIYLDNVYREVGQCSGRNEKLEVVLQFLALVASADEKKDVVLNQDNLVATIKNGDFADIAFKKSREMPACHELAPDLLVCFAINRTEAFEFVSLKNFKKLGPSTLEGIQLAKKNLAPLLPSELYVLESPLGIKFLDCGDDFTACSILSEGLMGFMQEQTPGTLLFGVPSRSELYFTAAQDAQSASNLQALVIQSWRENAHPISANLYTWQNQKIELYT